MSIINSKDGHSIKFNYDLFIENNVSYDKSEYVMYILVNDDLDMNAGKICLQCCNSISNIIKIFENMEIKPESYIRWVDSFEKKVILKSKEEDIIHCVNNYSKIDEYFWCCYVLDSDGDGISPFSITSVAFSPILIKNTPEFIKKMKVL